MADSKKAALRSFVAGSEPSVTQEKPLEQLTRIWEESLELSGRKTGPALWLALDATNSSRHKDETEANFHQRINNGVPITLFGASAPATGPDKLRHFFAAALIAFYLHQWLAELAGKMVEVLGWLTQPIGGTGYDRGDIFADNCGAKFGQALKRNPQADIKLFIAIMPPPAGK